MPIAIPGSRLGRIVMFFLAAILVPNPSAAQQQIFNGSINLGTGNDTVSYQQIVTPETCIVAAKFTHITPSLRMAVLSTILPQVARYRLQDLLTSSRGVPGHSRKVTVQPIPIVLVHISPHCLRRTTKFIFICKMALLMRLYVPGTFGYINPKYVIASVLYAPPGSKSTAVYTNSMTVSSTTSIQQTFISSTTVSSSTQTLSGIPTPTGVLAWFNGTSMTTSSTTET